MTRWCLVAGVILVAAAPCWAANDELTLANETSIELVRDSEGSFLGLGAISIGGVAVCAPRPPMRPLIETEAGGRYRRAQIESVDRGPRCAVVCKLTEKDSDQVDELRLVVRPAEAAIGGKWYVGFSYQYVFRSDKNIATRVYDLTHWELGGRSDGLYMAPPHRLSTKDALTARRAPEFLRTPCFYFQGGETGTLVVAYEFDEAAPLIYTEMDKPTGGGPTEFVDEINVMPGNEVHTPWRYVLFCKQDDLKGLQFVDEYTRCYEHFVKRVRDHFGIPAEPTRRLCIRAAEGIRPGGTTETYDDVIPMLDEIKRLGFERVWPASIWDNLGARKQPPKPNLGIMSMGFSDYGGGEEGLRRLCEAAEERGLKVYTWAPTGQLVTESPFWSSNPQWFPKKQDGSRYAYGGGNLTWTDLNSGYYDYSLEGFRRARELGIAGLWFDSFKSVASVVNYADAMHPTFNIIPAFKRMKELLEGLEYENVYIEGSGPAGIDAYPTGHFDTGGYTFYKAGKFYYHMRPTATNWYFRMLANHSTPIVALHYTLRTYRGNALADHPEQVARATYANQAFQKVRELMVERTLLQADDDPWDCTGTKWASADGHAQVYWPYVNMRVPLGPKQRAYEVVSGEEVRMESSGALFQAEHVYVVEEVKD